MVDPWFAAPAVGLDVAGADKDLAQHLEAGKFPDMKSALRAGMGGKGADVSAFEKVGWKGEAFAFDPDGADKDIAEFLAGKKPPDFRTALRSHMEADRVARERNVLPKPEKGKEGEWKGWSDLGWVEDPSKYVFAGKAKVPEGFEYDQAMEDQLRLAAHGARVPLAVAEKLRDTLVETQMKQLDAAKANGAKATADLQAALDKDWGADKPRNIELARRAMLAVGVGVDDSAELERIVGAPRLLKMFHGLAAKIGEQNLPAPGGGGGLPASLAAIDAELNRQAADKDFMAAFRDERHPMHAGRVAERQALLDKKAKLTPQQ